MPASMINLILWAPFGVVCLICGVLFVIAGYRRGVLNALVSLGGTIAAAALSLAVAKLVAGFLAPVVLKALPVVSPDALEAMGAALGGIVEGAAAMVVAMVLFMVLMLIITPVCKTLLKRFVRLPAGGRKMKTGGLAVRAADAVLFAFLLLVPIYGTLYNYLPVANAVMQLQPEQDSSVAAYVETAQKHPVVKLSGMGPADWVYRGLSQLNTDAVSVNAMKLTATIQDMAALMQEGDQSQDTGKNNTSVTKKLLTYARDNLLEEKWCSELIANVGVDYLKQQAEALGGDGSILSQVVSNLEITPEQFQEDGKDLLDLAISVMDLQSGELTGEAGVKELTQKLGSALTTNETVINIKNQVYTQAVAQLLNDDSQETKNTIQSQLGRLDLTPEEQMEEAQAFLQLLMGGDQEAAISKLTELGVLSGELIPTP